MAQTNPSYVFGADVRPSRIVQITGDHEVSEATAGTQQLVGVSHEGTFEAPIPGASELAGRLGESARIYGDGDMCEVIVGAVALAAGVNVTADANGAAIAATGVLNVVGKTLAAGAAAGKVRIQVLQFQLGGT